jgi:hypothetical protein
MSLWNTKYSAQGFAVKRMGHITCLKCEATSLRNIRVYNPLVTSAQCQVLHMLLSITKLMWKTWRTSNSRPAAKPTITTKQLQEQRQPNNLTTTIVLVTGIILLLLSDGEYSGHQLSTRRSISFSNVTTTVCVTIAAVIQSSDDISTKQ